MDKEDVRYKIFPVGILFSYAVLSCSIVSGSLQLQGLQPSRLLTILLNSRLYRGKYTHPRRPQREANISKMWQDERAEASFGGRVPCRQ